ncbi:hypothetical protein OG216_19510 [Streptomycetaceae bacterium NBC_01309]
MGVDYDNDGTELVEIIPPIPLTVLYDRGCPKVAPVNLAGDELHKFNVGRYESDCDVVIVPDPATLDSEGKPTHARAIGISINGRRWALENTCALVVDLIQDTGHQLAGHLKIYDDACPEGTVARTRITFDESGYDWHDYQWTS